MAAVQVQEQVPSARRIVPGSVNIAPAKFPATSEAAHAPDFDASKTATAAVDSFNKALSQADYEAVSKLFAEQGFWRDHLALTWEFRTVQGPQAVLGFLQTSSKSRDGLRLQKIALDASSAARAPTVVALDGQLSVVQLFITFETAIGAGQGVGRLVEDGSGNWKFFTLHTRLQELKGHEERINGRRPTGAEHGEKQDRKNWTDRRALEAEFKNGIEPAVLIVGAGQAGLTAAARLKMLGVEALIIDQNDCVGDNWRKRYHQLVLHDPVWYDHMPYLQFPPQWPIFTPKDKLAQFFEAYASLLELNVWIKTELGENKWDDDKRVWTVTVRRQKVDGSTETRTFHPRHIIQATGHSGKKNLPELKGMENFKGRASHSSEFPGACENGKGKKAVVVGSCNSAHDIAQDFVEKGYHVTIVQRSSTNIVSSKAVTELGFKSFYSEDGPAVDDADLMFHGFPSAVLKTLQIQLAERQAEHDRETLQGLARAGFKTDRGPDDAGLLFKYFQRGGGYYIDVGASQLIVDGRIKVKQGQEIAEVLPQGLRFADGTELEADELVLATGYQNMLTQARQLFGDAVVDRVGDMWGFNAEGELRTMWQRSGHEGFWLHGGNLALCRYYSLLLALQIKGLEAGLYGYGEK